MLMAAFWCVDLLFKGQSSSFGRWLLSPFEKDVTDLLKVTSLFTKVTPCCVEERIKLVIETIN